MRPAASGKRIELTERDLAIFRLLSRYRYLRSTHLHAFVGGKSYKRFIERLGHLFHEGGYLNRPQQQWQAINARYAPAVYELGERGWDIVREQGLDQAPLKSRKNGQRVIRQYQHELMICDVVSAIEFGIRDNPNLRFIAWPEILQSPKMPVSSRDCPNPLAMPVSVSYACPQTKNFYRSDKPLIPDAVFGIEYNSIGHKQYRFFALEADRNTEPVTRGNLEQSSYLRKILQYREIAARSLYKTQWGLPNLLVLSVTVNDRHMQNLMQLVDELTAGKGSSYLLFKTMPSLSSLEKAPAAASDMLTGAWQRVGLGPFCIDRV